MAGGGAVGGRLAQDSLPLSKCADAAPIRRRGSALSCDAERRAYQCCREYLGGAWRRVRPEELRVDPVRWEVRGQPLPECGPGAGTDAGSDAGHRDRGGADRGLSAWLGLQRRPQQPAVSLLAAGPPAQRGQGAPGGAAAALRGHPAGEGQAPHWQLLGPLP